jgi:hypothetical protein
MVMREATSQKQQEEVRVKAAAHEIQDGRVMAPPSEEEVRDRIEAQVKSLEDELYARLPALESGGLQPQVAGPIPWWDLICIRSYPVPPIPATLRRHCSWRDCLYRHVAGGKPGRDPAWSHQPADDPGWHGR